MQSRISRYALSLPKYNFSVDLKMVNHSNHDSINRAVLCQESLASARSLTCQYQIVDTGINQVNSHE